jgi:hypothetical protein
MVRHGWLAHVTARRQVTRANLRLSGELAHDRQANGIAECLEEADVRVGGTLHGVTISTSIYIDNDQCAAILINVDMAPEEFVVSYPLRDQDYNVVAWMLGGRNPRDAELRRHRRAIAAARVSGDSLLGRLRRAVRPASQPPVPALDCCPA